MTADSTARRERLAALVRARKPATQADWLALADEDEWLAMLETGGIAPHEWAELDDAQRALVVELVVVEQRPLVETLRLASGETKGTARDDRAPARLGAAGLRDRPEAALVEARRPWLARVLDGLRCQGG